MSNLVWQIVSWDHCTLRWNWGEHFVGALIWWCTGREQHGIAKHHLFPPPTLLLPHPLHHKHFMHWLSLNFSDAKPEHYSLLRFQFKAQLGRLWSKLQVVPADLSSLQQQTLSHYEQQLPVHYWSADLDLLQTIQRFFWPIAAHPLDLHLMVCLSVHDDSTHKPNPEPHSSDT